MWESRSHRKKNRNACSKHSFVESKKKKKNIIYNKRFVFYNLNSIVYCLNKNLQLKTKTINVQYTHFICRHNWNIFWYHQYEKYYCNNTSKNRLTCFLSKILIQHHYKKHIQLRTALYNITLLSQLFRINYVVNNRYKKTIIAH